MSIDCSLAFLGLFEPEVNHHTIHFEGIVEIIVVLEQRNVWTISEDRNEMNTEMYGPFLLQIFVWFNERECPIQSKSKRLCYDNNHIVVVL